MGNNESGVLEPAEFKKLVAAAKQKAARAGQAGDAAVTGRDSLGMDLQVCSLFRDTCSYCKAYGIMGSVLLIG